GLPATSSVAKTESCQLTTALAAPAGSNPWKKRRLLIKSLRLSQSSLATLRKVKTPSLHQSTRCRNAKMVPTTLRVSNYNSIIATAIPKITDQFNSLDDVGWYGSVSIFLFELGSLICGVAQNSVTLIIGRAVAGMGSAAIFSGAFIILAHSVPLERRPMYSGFIGSMYGIASVAGPLLGGAFTDKVTWRWCFFINLPIGAVTLLVIAIFFPDPQVKRESEPWSQRFRRFDPLGNLIFMPAIICLLLVMQWGGTTYAWNSWRVILLFCLLYWQQDFATVPPRIFLKRTVWSAAIFTFCIGAAFLSSVYYLPIWFQAVKNASAVDSGVMNLPLLISNVVASIISGVAVTTFGYYTPFMLLPSVITPISYGLMTTFHPNTPHSKWIGYQVLAGFGIGFGVQQPLIAVQVLLNIADVPTGTALMVFMQVPGGALFVSVDENVFSNKLVQYIVEDAITRTFIVGAAMAGISIIGALVVEWTSVKGKNIGM
ncbi:Efflux pump roqT, partial [Talaromyces pinophilus]